MSKIAVKRWSLKEENMLLKLFEEKKSIKDIAKELDRGEGAILIRLKKIAVRLHSEGLEPDEIELKTGIKKNDLEEQIKIEQRVQNKKLQGVSAQIKTKLKEIEELLP